MLELFFFFPLVDLNIIFPQIGGWLHLNHSHPLSIVFRSDADVNAFTRVSDWFSLVSALIASRTHVSYTSAFPCLQQPVSVWLGRKYGLRARLPRTSWMARESDSHFLSPQLPHAWVTETQIIADTIFAAFPEHFETFTHCVMKE